MHDGLCLRIIAMDTKKTLPGTRAAVHCLVYLLLCLASLSLASCKALWPVMAVRVSLPAMPPVWSGADGWELDWRCLDVRGEAMAANPGDTLVLFLPRTGFAAIRCKPVFGTSRGLPYGAIWPLETESRRELGLSPGGGFSAELAFRLYQGGYDAGDFNLGRLAREAELRVADPWDCDMGALAWAAAEGRFRADYLRAPGRSVVMVHGLPGWMAPASPWGKVLEPDAQGQVTLSASPGIHRWFGSDQELVVSVSSDGSSEWILRGTAGRVMQKVLP